jgi:O-antigen ligase
MSLRVLACLLFVGGFSFYAYRNWFVSLCAAVALMAVVKHPDMPRSMAGIPGFNLWNILIVNVVIAWWRQRRIDEPATEVPRGVKVAFWLYFMVVTVAFLRMFIDPTDFIIYTRMDIVDEFFLNSIRFLIPGYLFYEGCRSPERVKSALAVIVLLYFLLAIQVIRYMGPHPDFSGGAELSGHASKVLQRSIGYDHVDMSMMLSGASWAAIAFSNLVERRKYKWMVRGAACLIMLAQALTGGRTGYATWGLIGLIMCTIRWRKMLPLIPLAVGLVVVFMPAVADRMTAGFGGQHGNIVVHSDEFKITSGRNTIWPLVIDKIKQSPLLGYGRFAMQRTGLTEYIAEVLHDEFPHPHEAYLEVLLDNGVIGFFCLMPIFLILLKKSAGLFLDRNEALYEAAGGVALALLLALFVAGLGAQTFYPREDVVGMWAALGVALRVWVDRARRQDSMEDGYDEETLDQTVDVEDPQPVGSMRAAMA